MNIYDKKQITCYRCGEWVGEIAYDAVVITPKCGRCANPFPENDDKIAYLKNRYDNAKECLVVISS